MRIAILFVAISSIALACHRPTTLESPDGSINMTFELIEGSPVYSIQVGDRIPIKKSSLGLLLDEDSMVSFDLLGMKRFQIFEDYEMVWWKNKVVTDEYNELIVSLEAKTTEKQALDIVFRAYNDGVAFRYVFPVNDSDPAFTWIEDLSSFNFADDYTWWSANGERENLGPLPLSNMEDPVYSPMVIECSEDLYIGLLEAAIYDFANIRFKPGNTPHSVQCDLQGDSHGQQGMRTSWRTIMIGSRPGDLLESNLMVNLNPPCQIEDPSWIRTGTSMWDWRAWGYTAQDGFVYDLNTPSHKRFIDFAAENNVDFLLMDADWYGPEFSSESDPTQANQKIDIEENFRYANEKGIGIILYLNDVGARKFGLERVLKQFHDWGAAGIKYGFMRSSGQDKVKYTRQVIELCAKYELTVNFHDNPIPPSGDARTWPNVLTREYCHSQADAKRSYYPETAVSSPFINLLAGPVDMCNGWYAFEGNEVRPKVFEFIPGTVAAENAKLVVVFSGMSVLPDAPECYHEKADLFDFIRHLPDDYNEYRVLDGHMDSHIVVARRSGENWYLGALTNRDSRQVEIKLDFLNPDTDYHADIFEDAPDAHYMENREAYSIRQENVSSESKLVIKLAPGGGSAVRLIKSGS